MNLRIVFGVLIFCVLAARIPAAEVVTITEVSGRTTTDATLTEWSTDRVVVKAETQLSIPLDDVLTMAFQRQSTPLSAGDPLIILANGDRLVARDRRHV